MTLSAEPDHQGHGQGNGDHDDAEHHASRTVPYRLTKAPAWQVLHGGGAWRALRIPPFPLLEDRFGVGAVDGQGKTRFEVDPRLRRLEVEFPVAHAVVTGQPGGPFRLVWQFELERQFGGAARNRDLPRFAVKLVGDMRPPAALARAPRLHSLPEVAQRRRARGKRNRAESNRYGAPR